MRRLNQNKKENLAIIHNNLALVLFTIGTVSPLFTGFDNYGIFILKFIILLMGTIILLELSLIK